MEPLLAFAGVIAGKNVGRCPVRPGNDYLGWVLSFGLILREVIFVHT